jgi:hypothetical protein
MLGLSFLRLGLATPSACLVSISTSFMEDDHRKRQAFTATPAEPGDLPSVLGPASARSAGGVLGQERVRAGGHLHHSHATIGAARQL